MATMQMGIFTQKISGQPRRLTISAPNTGPAMEELANTPAR